MTKARVLLRRTREKQSAGRRMMGVAERGLKWRCGKDKGLYEVHHASRRPRPNPTQGLSGL